MSEIKDLEPAVLARWDNWCDARIRKLLDPTVKALMIVITKRIAKNSFKAFAKKTDVSKSFQQIADEIADLKEAITELQQERDDETTKAKDSEIKKLLRENKRLKKDLDKIGGNSANNITNLPALRK